MKYLDKTTGTKRFFLLKDVSNQYKIADNKEMLWTHKQIHLSDSTRPSWGGICCKSLLCKSSTDSIVSVWRLSASILLMLLSEASRFSRDFILYTQAGISFNLNFTTSIYLLNFDANIVALYWEQTKQAFMNKSLRWLWNGINL